MEKNQGIFKFIFFSILGVILFLFPLNIGGNSQIFISHFVDFVLNNFLDSFMLFTQIVSVIVLVGSIVFMFYTSKFSFLNDLFKSSKLNVFSRIGGSLLYLMVLNEWFAGTPLADAIINENTGGLMAGSGGLLTTLYLTFFIGVLILPLLTHFGAVEYIGTLCGPFVKKVFKVPGYSAIDAVASFVGDGTIGLVVTDTQYQRGYYTRREAYIIATSFSIVGIAFAAAVAEELGFGEIFPIFYGSIALSTIIIAIITARLPLKKYADEYYAGASPKEIKVPDNVSIHTHALSLAKEQASNVSITDALVSAFKSIINIYITFLPIIMLVGTTALVIAEFTNFFSIISAPFVPIYQLFGFSKDVALMMAPASIVGFADMYLPALFIGGSPSEASRFFIGVLSFTQLIFMSETGMVLMKTKIGVDFFGVVKVFLYRTILSIPIVLSITYLLSLINIITW